MSEHAHMNTRQNAVSRHCGGMQRYGGPAVRKGRTPERLAEEEDGGGGGGREGIMGVRRKRQKSHGGHVLYFLGGKRDDV